MTPSAPEKEGGSRLSVEEEVRRAIRLLETLMQAARVTRKDMDHKMGAGPGYSSQILTGRMELKFRHVIAILEALQIDPHVFFSTLYPGYRISSVPEQPEPIRWIQSLGPVVFGPPGEAYTFNSTALEKLICDSVRAALSEPGKQGRGSNDP